MMTQKGNQHGAHSKINPTGVLQATHIRIHYGDACFSRFPRVQEFGIVVVKQCLVTGIETVVFITTGYFKLLNKMTMPFNARQHGLKGEFVIGIIRMFPHRLKYLSYGNIAPGNIG
jgi:hypothetical protein